MDEEQKDNKGLMYSPTAQSAGGDSSNAPPASSAGGDSKLPGTPKVGTTLGNFSSPPPVPSESNVIPQRLQFQSPGSLSDKSDRPRPPVKKLDLQVLVEAQTLIARLQDVPGAGTPAQGSEDSNEPQPETQPPPREAKIIQDLVDHIGQSESELDKILQNHQQDLQIVQNKRNSMHAESSLHCRDREASIRAEGS